MNKSIAKAILSGDSVKMRLNYSIAGGFREAFEGP